MTLPNMMHYSLKDLNLYKICTTWNILSSKMKHAAIFFLNNIRYNNETLTGNILQHITFDTLSEGSPYFCVCVWIIHMSTPWGAAGSGGKGVFAAPCLSAHRWSSLVTVFDWQACWLPAALLMMLRELQSCFSEILDSPLAQMNREM